MYTSPFNWLRPWSKQANVASAQFPSQLNQAFWRHTEDNLEDISILRRSQLPALPRGNDRQVFQDGVNVGLLGKLPIHILGAKANFRTSLGKIPGQKGAAVDRGFKPGGFRGGDVEIEKKRYGLFAFPCKFADLQITGVSVAFQST